MTAWFKAFSNFLNSIIEMEKQEQLINNYIKAYNNFDIEGMLAGLAADVKFENISNGEVNLSLTGIEAFKQQAQQAAGIFSSRTQTVTSFNHTEDVTEVDIAYHAILAIDLPNGMKKGGAVNLIGKSVFKFLGDKIVAITDIS
jgi:3-deoxy-D-manno-octulosonic-acid transferase